MGTVPVPHDPDVTPFPPLEPPSPPGPPAPVDPPGPPQPAEPPKPPDPGAARLTRPTARPTAPARSWWARPRVHATRATGLNAGQWRGSGPCG